MKDFCIIICKQLAVVQSALKIPALLVMITLVAMAGGSNLRSPCSSSAATVELSLREYTCTLAP